MYVGDGEAGVTKGIVYSGRFQRDPQHSWHYASPAPTAGSIEASFGARGMGRRYPRSQRGRGWGSREPDPIAVVSDGLGNLGISYANGNPAAWNGSGSGIDFSAYDDIPVETSGSDVPEPAKTFAEIDLGEALNRNIQRCRYSKPTPVQRYAIPISLAGRDLMACAQTGSGKTAAFCFPIISKILKSCSAGPKNGSHHRGLACPSALILAPTRELSCQIYDEAKKFSDQTAVRVSVVYGGTPVFSQLHDLAKGVDILVATPGRLMDLIERSRISLHRVNFLTLDEADRMLDMGFEPQIRKIVEETNMPPPGTRQTMLFSATFPHTIQKLASDFLSNYIFLTVGRVGSSTELIKQKVEFVSDMDKRSCLMKLLLAERMKGRNLKLPLTLVFVETKRAADSLQSWLCRNGFPATAIHGDRSQPEREQALKSFKHGATPVMVATDVAARGLDIPHVAHVINFDLPRDIDSYVHRIGRTGRAGNSGLATAFFSGANEPLAKPLAELMKESSQEVPDWLSEYAERSFNGGERSRRWGGSRFGGRDFRKEMTFSSNSADGGGGGTGYSYGVDDGNCVTEGEISGGDVGKWTVNDAGYDEIVPTGWD